MLTAYGHVLDPVMSARNGILLTFTQSTTLYQQIGWAGPAYGILTVAGLIAIAAIYWLGWRKLWPIPAFLLWSCLIYVFNAPGLGGATELSVHFVYAVLAFACTYLFLRHGHLLSAGFLGYFAVLLVDVALHHTFLPRGVLGLVFEAYIPSLVTALQFLAVAVLVRMIWLMVRDNRAFFRSLDRTIRRRAAAQTFRMWWPMLAIFAAGGFFWWALANLWVEPAIIAQLDRGRTDLEKTMGPLLRADVEIDQAQLTEDDLKRLNFGDVQTFFAMITTMDRRMAANDWVSDQIKDHREKSQAFYTAWQNDQSTTEEEALERAVRRWMQLQIGVSNIRIQLGLIDAGYEAQVNGDFPAIASAKIREAFPRSALPSLHVPGCWFWQFGCLAEAATAKRINRLMDNLYNGMIGTVTGQLRAIDEAANGNAQVATQKARDFSQEVHEDFSEEMTRTIRSGFRTWRNISLLALVYSVIVLLKTLLIVFSRVVFSPKVGIGAAAQFLPHRPPKAPANISRHGALYRIPTSTPEAHFVSRWGVTLEGPPPARRRPLGFRFPIARILSGTWAMNLIDGGREGDEDEFDADLKVDEPTELVAWKLDPGERVLFRFADFVGMSEELRVRRISSLSITTLILGRMIYHSADGPGTLILRTTAAARISTDDEGMRPAPMPKLVAWGAETRFGVLAALTTVDTFLSGYNLKAAQGDRVVWDTSTKRGDGPGTGILRFVKSFLLPI